MKTPFTRNKYNKMEAQKTSRFEMSKKTKKKALDLAKDIINNIENNCYLISVDKSKELNQMLERHQRKEIN